MGSGLSRRGTGDGGGRWGGWFRWPLRGGISVTSSGKGVVRIETRREDLFGLDDVDPRLSGGVNAPNSGMRQISSHLIESPKINDIPLYMQAGYVKTEP